MAGDKDSLPTESTSKQPKLAVLWNRIAPVAGLVFALGVIAGILALYFTNPHILDDLKGYGYLGAFLISLILNGTVLFPIGNVAVMASLGMALPLPLLVGVAGGAGAAIGELAGYLLGRSGRGLLARNAMYGRLETWVKRWGWAGVFVLSVFPLVFDVIAIIAGALRMPLWRFMLACGIGRMIFYSFVAYLGAFWFKHIPWWAFLICFAAIIAGTWVLTIYLKRKTEKQGPGNHMA